MAWTFPKPWGGVESFSLTRGRARFFPWISHQRVENSIHRCGDKSLRASKNPGIIKRPKIRSLGGLEERNTGDSRWTPGARTLERSRVFLRARWNAVSLFGNNGPRAECERELEACRHTITFNQHASPRGRIRTLGVRNYVKRRELHARDNFYPLSVCHRSTVLSPVVDPFNCPWTRNYRARTPFNGPCNGPATLSQLRASRERFLELRAIPFDDLSAEEASPRAVCSFRLTRCFAACCITLCR